MAHREYYNAHGVQVPSVTAIVKLLDKENLSSWHNWMGLVKRINTTDYLEQRAQYGTYCHTLFQTYFMGFLTHKMKQSEFVSDKEFTTILEKFDWLKKKFRSHDIVVTDMELGMDGERFGGTLDMLAVHKNTNRVFLLDLKTSKRVYPSHFLQLAGYTLLLEETLGISVTDVGIIILSKPKEHMLHFMQRSQNAYNEEIFQKLLDIYYIQQQVQTNQKIV